MTSYLSVKIRNIGFISIIVIIFYHGFYQPGEADVPLLQVVKRLSPGYVGVVLFSIISGYLFFLSQTLNYRKKLLHRVQTLTLPFFIAVTIGLVYLLVMKNIAGVMPYINEIYNQGTFDRYCHPFRFAWVRLHYVECNVMYHLWFIRDLMIVCVCTPLIYLFAHLSARHLAVRILYLLSLAAALVIFGDTRSTVFLVTGFALGALAALDPHVNIAVRQPKTGLLATVVFSAYMLAYAFTDSAVMRSCYDLAMMVGAVAVWYGYDYVAGALHGSSVAARIFRYLSYYTFFLFLFHEPLLTLLRRLTVLNIHGEVALTVAYIVFPAIDIAILCSVAYFLERKFPQIYKDMSGGRGHDNGNKIPPEKH